jgi:hypothetical protein
MSRNNLSWIAHYDDGTRLVQYNGASPPATYGDIDRARLAAFELVDVSGRTLVVVDFRDDSGGDEDVGPKRLIWRVRHRQDAKGGHDRIHLVGWQRLVKGRNMQAVLYVNDETGGIVMGGQPSRHPLMHEVRLQEQER